MKTSALRTDSYPSHLPHSNTRHLKAEIGALNHVKSPQASSSLSPRKLGETTSKLSPRSVECATSHLVKKSPLAAPRSLSPRSISPRSRPCSAISSPTSNLHNNADHASRATSPRHKIPTLPNAAYHGVARRCRPISLEVLVFSPRD